MLATQQTPQYSVIDQFVESICYRAAENRKQCYPPLMRSAESLAQRAISADTAICHPKHRYLEDVWKELVVNDNRSTSWSCADIGYGVGFALRKW